MPIIPLLMILVGVALDLGAPDSKPKLAELGRWCAIAGLFGIALWPWAGRVVTLGR